MKYFRSHPVKIIENTSKYLGLLIIPIVRVIFASPDGFRMWLSGAWLDILVIVLILSLGIYHWYSFVFCYDEEGIFVKKGILIKKHRFISFSKLSCTSIEEPFLYLPFKAVRVKIDTDGGINSRFDFYVTVKKQIAQELVKTSKKPFLHTSKISKKYIPNSFYIAIFSFINSDTLTGVIYLALSISKVGDIFGEEFGNMLIDGFSKFTNFVSFGLPPIAVYVAYAMLGCWLISFLINLIRHLRFEACRNGDIIDIFAGIINKKSYSLIVPRINFIMIRQSLITRILGFYSVEIQCTGYGKNKNEKAVIFPSGEHHEIRTNLKLLLPHMDIAKRQIKPKLKYLTRFLFMPALSIVALILCSMILLYFVETFDSTVIMLTVIFLIPLFWWLCVKLFAYKFTGIGVNENVYTIYYTKAYQIITCSIPKEKIVKIVVYQSLLQLRKKSCDVIFYSYAESKKSQRVMNMPIDEVKKLLKISDNDLQIQRKIGVKKLWT